MKGRLPTILLAAAFAALAWAAWTVTVEYYDGFEYLLTARALLGSRLFWYMHNPALSAFLALVAAPWRAAGGAFGLRGFHLAMLALNAAGALVAALWIRRVGARVPLAAAALVVVCNRLFAHYALFAMGDLPAAFSVAACLWAEAAQPLEPRRVPWARAALLALCALGRPQAALIPGASLLVEAARGRRWKEAAAVAAAAAALYGAAIALVYRLVGVPFAQGIPDHARMMVHFLIMANGSGHTPAWDRGVFLWLLLTPVGALLLAAGLAELGRPERRGLRSRLAGPATGAALYVAFLFAVDHLDARFLSPLLPFWALAQCLALEGLSRRRAWAAPLALIALFLFCAPEVGRFADPFYRADRERTLSEEIASWTGARQFFFFGDSAPFHPESPVFHRDDDYFYVYHWNAPAFMFFTGLPANLEPRLFHAGWPWPDGVSRMPSGQAAVSPAPGPSPTSRLPARAGVVYAFRRTAGPTCGQAPSCVEYRAFPLRPGG